MMLDLVYDSSPWLVAVAFLALGGLFAAGCLLAVGRWVRPETRARHADLIGLAVTNVAVFYGVLLAFLAVAVWEDAGEASASVGREAALVGNMYTDMEGLPPPLAADLQAHARAYLETIVEQEWPAQAEGRVPAGTSVALVELHRHVAALAPTDGGDSIIMANMLETLNDLDAARATRLEAVGGHVAPLLWVLIVVLGLLTVGLAAFFPAESPALHAVMLGGIVAGMAAMMLMTVELDHPFRGALSVSSDAYRQVLARMDAAAAMLQAPAAKRAHQGVPGR